MWDEFNGKKTVYLGFVRVSEATATALTYTG